jgi:hypothetical protein
MMRYSEAFADLGYTLDSPRQDWTAEKAGGVCITIWQSEMSMKDGRPWLDTRLHCGPLEIWLETPGNKKRKRHLQRALTEFGGAVDVIIVRGIAGEKVDGASPWRAQERQGFKWRITDFESETGHFTAEAFAATDQ